MSKIKTEYPKRDKLLIGQHTTNRFYVYMYIAKNPSIPSDWTTLYLHKDLTLQPYCGERNFYNSKEDAQKDIDEYNQLKLPDKNQFFTLEDFII
jgi:hypothetical protein